METFAEAQRRLLEKNGSGAQWPLWLFEPPQSGRMSFRLGPASLF
jgi:hypothetical protein